MSDVISLSGLSLVISARRGTEGRGGEGTSACPTLSPSHCWTRKMRRRRRRTRNASRVSRASRACRASRVPSCRPCPSCAACGPSSRPSSGGARSTAQSAVESGSPGGERHSAHSIPVPVQPPDQWRFRSGLLLLLRPLRLLLLGGPRTKPQSTLMGCPASSDPFKPSMAACASLYVSYSTRA